MEYYRKNGKIIRVYHTHITIFPYELGEHTRFEHMLSIYIEAEYRYDSIGYYWDPYERILYVPRGTDLVLLKKEFNSDPVIVKEHNKVEKFKGVKMMTPPRDRIQTQSIDFLSGKNESVDTLKYSQQALILDTGDGKTYAAVHAIINLRMKACIITHQDSIKLQWINTFLDRTNIPRNSLINVVGSETMTDIINEKISGNIYFINHQTINSFAKQFGWPAVAKFFEATKVGIKIFDEAHKNFKNVLRVDFFSNVYKTFYLTANFGRTDVKEGRLYRRAFSNVVKFGEQTKNYQEKRKHIVYIPVLYRSNPSLSTKLSVMSSYGFSVLRFSQYAIHDDPDKTQLNIFDDVFMMALKLEGKILITVPKISDTEFMVKYIHQLSPFLHKSIGTINSKNDKDTNQYVKENCDIICSTIKSCGTGVDIKGLRCVINLEPFSSHITANQLAGRLREYAPDKDTYFFDLIDIAFNSCEHQYRSKLANLRKKCKEVKVLKK